MLNLLFVGTLTPRKGHAVLLEALNEIRDRHWHLTCAGSLVRDTPTVAAVQHLLNGGSSGQFNVGTGSGRSVREVIRAVEEVTGKPVPYTVGPRRAGDPAELVADSSRLQSKLGWKPRYTDLRDVVRTAWDFDNKRHIE